MLSPKQRYDRDIAQHGFIADKYQLAAINGLDVLFWQLQKPSIETLSSIYLWGSVGSGKTYLMDCFYASLAGRAKRMHYYRFMQFLHQSLKRYQGKKDPLVLVAQEILKTHKILCLDEFFVSDIADAMLLGRLLKVLFEQGLVLVTTSNVEPCGLYKEGLQRDRFLPAIAMLEQNLTIIPMQGGVDHRLAKAQGFINYYLQVQASTEADLYHNLLYQRFITANTDINCPIETNLNLTIEARIIECIARKGRDYCFSFEQLFKGPRSANDYIALSQMVKCIYLLNVPQMGGRLNERKVARGTEDTYNINQRVADRPFVLAQGDDEARRFISFIDQMYDQNRLVIIGAQVPLMQLYKGGRVVFEFERTVSRLIEMQSDDYVRKE